MSRTAIPIASALCVLIAGLRRLSAWPHSERHPDAPKGTVIRYTSSDPTDRAIAGSSPGGIAAFTAARNRPDAFHASCASLAASQTCAAAMYTLRSSARPSLTKPGACSFRTEGTISTFALEAGTSPTRMWPRRSNTPVTIRPFCHLDALKTAGSAVVS
jgi:hypothetical protein